MNRLATTLCILASAALLAAAGPAAGRDGSAGPEPAWAAWERGEILEAESLAASIQDAQERNHLLFLCSFVRGDYEKALLRYAELTPSYPKTKELDRPVVDALLHLSRVEEAERFAKEKKMAEHLCRMLAACAKQPLRVSLAGTTEVPFKKVMLQGMLNLTDYIPGFGAELNGKEVNAFVDTGGAWLHMSLSKARKLGIEVFEAGSGFQGTMKRDLYFGMAKSFRLGEARLENVPIVVFSTITGGEDMVIFGTSILKKFLATLDYPGRRLVLSPRGNPALRKAHLGRFRKDSVEIPFYLWGDHYMFARGGVGGNRKLNFFIDSGLVSIHPDRNFRQAAFTTPKGNYEKWGVDSTKVKSVFELSLPLCLGPLEQKGHLVLGASKAVAGSFGGVKIHGLISHAFLKRYAWTLDFDLRRYLFSGDVAPADVGKGEAEPPGEEAEEKPEEAGPSAGPLGKYEGKYKCDMIQARVIVKASGGMLSFSASGNLQGKFALQKSGEDKFQAVGAPRPLILEFEIEGGKAVRIKVSVGGQGPFLFKRE
jgi:hypothetical protein